MHGCWCSIIYGNNKLTEQSLHFTAALCLFSCVYMRYDHTWTHALCLSQPCPPLPVLRAGAGCYSFKTRCPNRNWICTQKNLVHLTCTKLCESTVWARCKSVPSLTVVIVNSTCWRTCCFWAGSAPKQSVSISFDRLFLTRSKTVYSVVRAHLYQPPLRTTSRFGATPRWHQKCSCANSPLTESLDKWKRQTTNQWKWPW